MTQAQQLEVNFTKEELEYLLDLVDYDMELDEDMDSFKSSMFMFIQDRLRDFDEEEPVITEEPDGQYSFIMLVSL